MRSLFEIAALTRPQRFRCRPILFRFNGPRRGYAQPARKEVEEVEDPHRHSGYSRAGELSDYGLARQMQRQRGSKSVRNEGELTEMK